MCHTAQLQASQELDIVSSVADEDLCLSSTFLADHSQRGSTSFAGTVMDAFAPFAAS